MPKWQGEFHIMTIYITDEEQIELNRKAEIEQDKLLYQKRKKLERVKQIELYQKREAAR